MHRLITIPLVREAVREPFVQAARVIGTPIEPILQSAGLPTPLEGNGERLLPELPCWHFIQKVARQESINVRTLQRRLAQHDLSYSCVLDQSRFLKAEALLGDADTKLLDISLMLGFSDAASFTRAFRRWAGVSPREYRRQCPGN